jgi:hypothetical protein
MSAIEILAVIGIIGFIIFRQVQGEPLRGKRTVLLPAILTVVGFLNLHGSGGAHLSGTDIACLAVGTAGSAVIGLTFGAVTRLDSRGGYLWAQLPPRGLWLWAALVAWRVAVILLAAGLHAHLAASSATLLLSLGVNRLAQAAVIVARAMAMGVPFAPEKDGKVFMAGTLDRGPGARRGPGRFSRGGFDGRGGQGTWGSQGGCDGQDGYGSQNDRGGAGGYDPENRYGTGDRPPGTRPQRWDRS